MPNVDDLEVYHRSHSLVLDIYAVTNSFPREALYSLTSQMRRSAYSIPMNLAEGCGRSSDPELRRFIDIAVGSVMELRYQTRLASDLSYLSSATSARLNEEIGHIGRMLRGLRRTVNATSQ